MFGFFKKKPKNPAEELEASLTLLFDTIRRADKMDEVMRVMSVGSALSAWFIATRRVRANIATEPDSPAMVILAGGQSPEQMKAARQAVEYVIRTALECPNEKYTQAALVWQFFAPRTVEKEYRRLEAENKGGV